MKIKIGKNIIKTLKRLLFVLVLVLIIGFVEKKHSNKVCRDIFVQVQNDYHNYFLSQADILELATEKNTNPLVGEKLIHIDLKTIENRLKKDKFVESVNVFKDLAGNLTIQVRQSRPIARIYRADSSLFLGKNGSILPFSKRYIVRLPVLSGEGTKNYLKGGQNSAADSALVQMMQYIYDNEFWKAQVSQVEIDKNGDLFIYPQVTKQVVEFGKPFGFKEKLSRLKVFYEDVLSVKGWNTYSTVNVKYKDQIICK